MLPLTRQGSPIMGCGDQSRLCTLLHALHIIIINSSALSCPLVAKPDNRLAGFEMISWWAHEPGCRLQLAAAG